MSVACPAPPGLGAGVLAGGAPPTVNSCALFVFSATWKSSSPAAARHDSPALQRRFRARRFCAGRARARLRAGS